MQYDPLPVFGDFPPFLVRAYSEEHWARAFVEEGRFRLSLLQYFAQIEDSARGDQTEGQAHLQIPQNVQTVHFDGDANITRITEAPGYVNLQGAFMNPVYICCFSYPPDGDLTKLPEHFGEHRVLIEDPLRFAQDVTDWLTEEGVLRGTPVVECCRVVYNKGEKGTDTPDHLARVRLTYAQKPPRFANECEYRFVVVATPTFEKEPEWHHEVNLGHRLPYVRYLSPAV
jgi:hypothetical protein